MKEKTSITLSRDILSRLDRLAGSKGSRSAVIENILRIYFRQAERARTHSRDLELINKNADRLNAEALDALEYQASEE
jgi:metal-responsive CopG/Arc/MetJ family transcriptional regulator